MTMIPETKYAKSGEVYIAYQVVGDGPRDLVLIPPFVSHVELYWEEPSLVRFLTRLASFARLIVFDKRGTGLSDRVAPHALPDLQPLLDLLAARGTWMAPAIYAQVLKLSQEIQRSGERRR